MASFISCVCCCLFCTTVRAQRILRLNDKYLQANNVEQYGSNDPLPYISSDTITYQQMQLASITPMTTNGDDPNSKLISDDLKELDIDIDGKYEAL